MDNIKMVPLQEVLNIIDGAINSIKKREDEEEKWNAYINYRHYHASISELKWLKKYLIENL